MAHGPAAPRCADPAGTEAVEAGFGTFLRFMSTQAVTRSALGSELSLLLPALAALGGGVWALSEDEPAAETDLLRWEARNGVPLPSDLRVILQVCNGITVRWGAPLGNRIRDVGALSLNGLDRLVKVPPTSLHAAPEELLHAGLVVWLSSSSGYGQTALAFADSKPGVAKEPQVWFQDLGHQWHLLAHSFLDYLRLVFVHFGVRGWEYAFTSHGLDQEALQWLRVLAPGRLEINAQQPEFSLPSTVAAAAAATEGQSGASKAVSLEFLDDPDPFPHSDDNQRPSSKSSRTSRQQDSSRAGGQEPAAGGNVAGGSKGGRPSTGDRRAPGGLRRTGPPIRQPTRRPQGGRR